ncbi:hypothetical protein [Phytohabitans kaempferiae]|uniref:Uncharacterized protein n=1 Tax=Phytohabitans kaempferiae TaxID=1620943 RepID=A0ABV6MC01_9ACTN
MTPTTDIPTTQAAAGGVDAVVLGPLSVDYTVHADPADIHEVVADLLPGGSRRSVLPAALVVDQATIVRVLTVLRGPRLHAEPGGHSLRVAHRLADELGRRVGMVGVAGQSLRTDLAIPAELVRHGVDQRQVSADDALAGITLTIPAGAGQAGGRLVYTGANRRLPARLRRDQTAVAAYLAGARLVHAVLVDDPDVVPALARVLTIARRINPALVVSIDTTLCLDRPPEPLSAFAGLVDVAIGAAAHDPRQLASPLRRPADPGAVVANMPTSRHGLTVVLVDTNRVDVWRPGQSVTSVPARAVTGPTPHGDRAADVTVAVVTAVEHGGDVVAAVEAAISDTVRPSPQPCVVAAAEHTAPPAPLLVGVLFGTARRGRVAVLAVAVLGWPAAVVGLAAGWPMLACAALPLPYLVLRLAVGRPS